MPEPKFAAINARYPSRVGGGLCGLIAVRFIQLFQRGGVLDSTHAADLPTTTSGECVAHSSGASMGLAVRTLTYVDGKLQGRADVWMRVPKAAVNCSRADVEIHGSNGLAADGRLEKMVATYPSAEGPSCDDLTVTFNYDAASDSFVGEGPVFRWILRAPKQ